MQKPPAVSWLSKIKNLVRHFTKGFEGPQTLLALVAFPLWVYSQVIWLAVKVLSARLWQELTTYRNRPLWFHYIWSRYKTLFIGVALAGALAGASFLPLYAGFLVRVQEDFVTPMQERRLNELQREKFRIQNDQLREENQQLIEENKKLKTMRQTTPLGGTTGGSVGYPTGSCDPVELLFPIEGGEITGWFGWSHTGVDISAPYGAPIKSVLEGIVAHSGFASGGWGWSVWVNNNGWSHRYAHMSKTIAYVGQYVEKGQVIGYTGSSGFSSGNHLHLEWSCNAKLLNAVEYVK